VDLGRNLLFYGDNLDILRQHVRDESVDLVYLDPRFRSDAMGSVGGWDCDLSRLSY
jgi:site-specific DNA-methyltransferase (adenine-specific)